MFPYPSTNSAFYICSYSFGSAFILPIPEIPPFRMTPNIVTLMHPFKHHGIFKDTMTKDLQVLRKNQDIILAALTVFVSEPTMVN